MKPTTFRLALGAAGGLLVGIVGVIWLIAGSERLFQSTVPLEQRLVSYNESIRKKAQQELLGLSSEAKRSLAVTVMPALRRDDPFVRKWAAISLALIGPSAREAIPALLQSVSDKEGEVAQASRVAISEIGVPDPAQVPALLTALQDPRDAVRCEAAASLARMGAAGEEALPLLAAYLSKPSPACFDDALALLLKGLPAKAGPVIDLLSSGLPDLKWRAASVLAKAGRPFPDHARILLTRASEEKDPRIHRLLARSLGLSELQADGPEAVARAALRSSELPVRMAAIEWAGTLNLSTQTMASLWATLLRDADAALRRRALVALRQSDSRISEAIPVIARAQRDPDLGVRCRAVETLIEWNATDRVAVPLLVADLRAEDESARCAMSALAQLGLFHNGVVSEMIRLLRSRDRLVRSRAAAVLAPLGARAREAIPALEKAHKEQVPGAGNALRAIRASLPAASQKRRKIR